MGTNKFKKSENDIIRRRKYSRSLFKHESLKVAIKLDDGKPIDVRLMNISIDGVAVAVPHPVVLAWDIKEVIITFPDGREARCSANVRYAFRVTDSAWNTYGIQFTGLQMLKEIS